MFRQLGFSAFGLMAMLLVSVSLANTPYEPIHNAQMTEPSQMETNQPNEKRLVSADAGVTQLITALGMLDYLVAVDVTSPQIDQLSTLARIGYHRNLSAEGLLSLNPSHVIGSDHMGPQSTLNALEQAGVKLVNVATAYSLAELKSNVMQVGELLGKAEQADALVEQIQQRSAALLSQPLNQSAVFILSSRGQLRLAGNDTAGQAFMNLLGLKNAATFTQYRTVSAEGLLAMKPDVILIAGDLAQQPAEQALAAMPWLSSMPAVQQQRLLGVDGATLVSGLSLASVDEATRIQNALLQTSVQASVEASVEASAQTQVLSQPAETLPSLAQWVSGRQ